MITLKAVARDVKVNPKSIRRNGDIPAVYYGFGKAPVTITVNKLEFTKMYQEVGESTIFTLETPAGKLDALVQDVALDPVVGTPIHIDFYITAKDHKMQVHVPFEFIGVSPAEKLGGVVSKIMHELHVEALPAQLPNHITIDLSTLVEVNSHVTVADLKLGSGVRALVADTEVIALVAIPGAPKEDEVTPAPDLSSIEVVKKGKKEEEAEEPAK
jgi:large subunit ribosomal protein L25